MATKAGKTVDEPVSYTEIATYRHQNPGKVSIETVSSVNEPVHPSKGSQEITQVSKVRVETHVKEWKGVSNEKVYQKDYETIQTSMDSGNIPSSSFNKTYDNPEQPEKKGSEPSALAVVKNFLDQVDNRLKDHQTLSTVLFVALGMVAVAALVLAII